MEASFATALVLVKPQVHVRPRWAVAFEARLVAMREALDLVYNFVKQNKTCYIYTYILVYTFMLLYIYAHVNTCYTLGYTIHSV